MIYIEKDINSNEIKDLIQVINNKTRFLTVNTVKKVITDVFETTASELSSKSRKQEIARKRHIFVFLMYNLTRANLLTIAKHIDRDHSTMINSRKAVVDSINYDKEFNRYFVNKLLEMNDLFTEKTTSTVIVDNKVIKDNE